MNAGQQTQVDAYLMKLRRSLRELPADVVNDILREIRSHILERAEASGELSDAALVQILKELGRPEEIGPLYQAEAMISRARSSFSPVLIVRTTMSWAMKSVVGLMALLFGIFGYGLAVGFFFSAIAKPFQPARVGLWIGQGTIQLGTSDMPLSQEVLGWWIIPVGLVGGWAAFVFTTLLLRYLLRFATNERIRAALARIGLSGAGVVGSSNAGGDE